jgi:hypothetical protein
MTRRKPIDVEPIEIFPDNVYRTSLSPAIFGLGFDQTRRKIRNGELPTPHRPTPTSKFEVWTGQQIIDHRIERQKIAAEELAAERANPSPQPPQLAAVKDRPRKKTKKVTLRPPGNTRTQRTSTGE